MEQQVTAMAEYLEGGIMTMPPENLVQALRNHLLTLLSYLDQLAAGDVKQRMARVITYLRDLAPEAPAGEVLR